MFRHSARPARLAPTTRTAAPVRSTSSARAARAARLALVLAVPVTVLGACSDDGPSASLERGTTGDPAAEVSVAPAAKRAPSTTATPPTTGTTLPITLPTGPPQTLPPQNMPPQNIPPSTEAPLVSPGEAVVPVSTTVAPAPVELTGVDWSTALAGLVGADTAAEARLEDAVYVDLGGDERVELVIPVGRARRGGGVVLAAADGGARLAGSFLAPSSTVGVFDGALEVTEPSFRTEDSLCCPSAWSHRTYTFDGERMQLQQGWLTADVAGAVATVQRYYDLLNRRDFGAAYDLLHPTVQAATPVEAWAALVGRNLTVRVVDAAAVAGDGPRTVPTGTPVGVAVTREVVRQDEAGQPQPLAERGTWTLVYSGERQRWELTEEHLTSPRP